MPLLWDTDIQDGGGEFNSIMLVQSQNSYPLLRNKHAFVNMEYEKALYKQLCKSSHKFNHIQKKTFTLKRNIWNKTLQQIMLLLAYFQGLVPI